MKQGIWIAGIIILLVGVGVVIAKVKSAGSLDSSTASSSVRELLEEASQAQAQGEDLKAKEAYQQIISDHPDYDKAEDIQNKLGELNMKIIFSKTQTPQTLMYQVQPGDSLGKLAKQHHTTTELIKMSNNLKSDVIRVGQNLRIWQAPFSIVVNKSQNILVLKSGEETIKVYHVSTGKDADSNATPEGAFKIASKIPNPVWFKSGSKPIPPESPENALGSRWMGFDIDPHYGIHGTNEPDLIGQNATAGCVRLRNSDVEELFNLVPVGTTVKIEK